MTDLLVRKKLFAAVKFVGGPGDDSAYRAKPIPAPGAALLALLGMPMIGWVRRKIA